jgi:tetratricopeptide (TPR) repeat protein
MLRGVMELYRANAKLSVPELADALARTAAMLRDEGKTKEALKMSEAAVEVESRESGEDSLETAPRLIDLARTQLAASLASTAVATAERAVRANESNADAWRVLATAYGQLGELNASIRALQKAVGVEAARTGADSEETADLVLQQVDVLTRTGQLVEAQELLGAARTVYEREGKIDKVADVLRRAGMLYLQADDFDRAEEMLRTALTIQRNMNMPAAGIAETIEDLAYVAEVKEDFPAARKLLEDAYFRRSTSRDRSDPALIETLRRIGEVAAKQGEYDVARERLEAAIEIAEAGLPHENPLHASLRLSLARVVKEMGWHRRAEELARSAVKYAMLMTNTIASPQVVLTAANLLASLDAGDVAGLFRDARDAFARLGDSYGEARAAQWLGKYLADRGSFDEAATHLQHARGVYRRLGIQTRVEEVDEQLAALPPAQ